MLPYGPAAAAVEPQWSAGRSSGPDGPDPDARPASEARPRAAAAPPAARLSSGFCHFLSSFGIKLAVFDVRPGDHEHLGDAGKQNSV